MIVFAAGNKFKIEVDTLEFTPEFNCWYAYGVRWVKSKQAWASDKSRGLCRLGPHYEEVKKEAVKPLSFLQCNIKQANHLSLTYKEIAGCLDADD